MIVPQMNYNLLQIVQVLSVRSCLGLLYIYALFSRYCEKTMTKKHGEKWLKKLEMRVAMTMSTKQSLKDP